MGIMLAAVLSAALVSVLAEEEEDDDIIYVICHNKPTNKVSFFHVHINYQ
jgi:hypothetical protein